MEKYDDESKLLSLIDKFQRLIDDFHKNSKNNISVVLIVGQTGSGKSTIFNFLSGADFTINDKKEMVIRNYQNKFSKMNGGMNSITKEPNFYHNTQNNHLIVDFPGFQDTNGEWDQLLIELLFHKIATSGPIKIIYVIKNPENSLPNRGSDLQEFIKQVFLKGNINVQKFTLLLNCYLEDLTDEQLSNKIKDDLKSVNLLQQIDKLLVVKKAKKLDELQQIFNDQQRQRLWQQIGGMQTIKIKPQELPNNEIISEYLRSTAIKTIEKYGAFLLKVFDETYLKLTETQGLETYQNLKKLLQVINRDNNEGSLNWYTNFTTICEQLAKSLSVNCEVVKSSNNFKRIYIYFSQFSEHIKGYKDIAILKSMTQEQLKRVELIINLRLEFLEQTKEKIQEMENEKSQLQLSLYNKEQQVQNLSRQLDSQNIAKKSQQDQQLNKYVMQINRRLQMLSTYQSAQRADQIKIKNQEQKINQLEKDIEEMKKKKKETCQLI